MPCLFLMACATALVALAAPADAQTAAPAYGVPPAAPAAAAPLGASLDRLLAAARSQHPELRAMAAERDAAAQRVIAAGSLRDPQVGIEWRDVTNEASGGSLNLLPGRVGSTRYSLKQSFAPWGQRDARRTAARAGADEANAKAQAAWTELAYRIKVAYARWQQAHAQRDETAAILALLDRLDAVAQARYAQGLAAQQDVVRVQLERTAMRSEQAMLDAELAIARVRLNGLLARPGDAPLAAPRPDPLPPAAALDAPDLRARLLARNPQLAAEAARRRAAEGNRDAVLANRWPEVSVGVAPIQMGSRIREWELMLEVSLPLQQGARRADAAEALAMIEAAGARRDALAVELTAMLDESLAMFASARTLESQTANSLLPLAEVALQAALAGYENARVDFMTVLDAQRQIRTARLNLIRQQTEARARLAEIERLIGEDLR